MFPYEFGAMEVSRQIYRIGGTAMKTDSEFQVFARPEFRDINDLTDMESEMFEDDREDFKDGPVTILNPGFVEETRRIEPGQRPIRLEKRVVQSAEEFIFWSLLTLREFLRFVPGIRSPADPRQNELVEVSCEMQQKVADAVVRFVLPPPNVVVRELLDAPLEAREVLAHESKPAPFDI
jgi:hypothetical protein